MKFNWRRVVSMIFVNVILFFVFAEILALGIYFFRDGKVFYTNKRIYQPIQETEEGELTYFRFHPFLGYILKPGLKFQPTGFTLGPDQNYQWAENEVTINKAIAENPDWKDIRTNNYGFFSVYDYPFVRENKNQYLIGIFGGSVADRFSVQGEKHLIENLKKTDSFKDKEIIILNFSSGGYKQPQQLQALTYFLSLGQEFDMVINIDGFNEVALSNLNNKYGLDISMPSANHINSIINLVNPNTLSSARLASLAKIDSYKIQLNKLAEIINRVHFASISFFLEQYYTTISNKYREELVVFEQLQSNNSIDSMIYVNPLRGKYEDQVLFDKITDNWVASSILMCQILDARKIPYFEFIQPNQYYSERLFNDKESKIVLDPNSRYKEGVEKGYPFLVQKLRTLEDSNVDIYSAIEIFDDVRQNVYSDNCCHYNQLGNEIMADFIAKSILYSSQY